ncbi:MAG: septal ring factor EnvC (AmiA/AmiB activator) [Alteromonadaceae bacterium]|jgi:septal ring factor EnvC (AmiA/AmiB activator)
MTLLKKFAPAIITTCLLTAAVFSVQSETQQNGYKIQILDNCQVIKEYKMTHEQIEYYLALQVEEKKMSSLEAPISAIQDSLDNYSAQIEELTALVIQETDQSLYIDKDYLKQQEHVVEKLNILMKAHQQDFTALGQQGKIIGKVADTFVASLKDTIGESKHQQIHIVSPDEHKKNYQCDNDIFNI